MSSDVNLLVTDSRKPSAAALANQRRAQRSFEEPYCGRQSSWLAAGLILDANFFDVVLIFSFVGVRLARTELDFLLAVLCVAPGVRVCTYKRILRL